MDGKVVANYDDYFFGRLAFMKTHSTEQCIPMSTVDKAVVEFVKTVEGGSTTAKEIADNVNGATNYYCYKGLPRLVKSGLLNVTGKYSDDCHKKVPHYFYSTRTKIFLPLLPDGLEIDSAIREAILDITKNQKTNQKTNNTVESSSILVLCYIINKCKSYSVDLSKKPKETSHSTPYFQYFDRYFGILTDDDAKDLQDIDWSV